MAKVLEGNYSDNTNRHCQEQPIWGCGEMGEAELEAIERVLREQTSVSLQTQ